MNKTFPSIGVVSVLVLFNIGTATGAILTGPITNAATGNANYLLASNGWNQSEAEAVALGGHLVTIEDEQENTWVFNTFATFGGVQLALWIGLTDQGHEGTFVWAGARIL